MGHTTRLFSLAMPLLLILLFAVGGIALHRTRTLVLPISKYTNSATMVLPIVTGVFMGSLHAQYGHKNTKQGSDTRVSNQLYLLMGVVVVVYDTVIATLALTNMTPPGALRCSLEDRWTALFRSRNSQAIRTIQDRHDCCGFNTIQHMAWPFPDASHTTKACVEAFDRAKACAGGWRQDLQITAGLILLVALVSFLLKVTVVIVYQSQGSFASYDWSPHDSSNLPSDIVDEGGEQRHERIEAPYHDERDSPAQDFRLLGDQGAGDGASSSKPIVAPSRLQQGRNEWSEV